MSTFIIVGLLILIAVLIVFNIKIVLQGKEESGERERLNVIEKQLDGISQSGDKMREVMDHKLEFIHKSGQNQFREAREIIGEITRRSDNLIENVNKKLGSLDKTNQKIVDFSSQLQSLQDILKNPKQRGVLGEFILEQVLGNVLPPDSFQTQYGFKNGVIVDAVVFVKEKIIPIDSKFSLENYERIINAKPGEDTSVLEKSFKQDLKKRIDETSKYIKPEENTTDFAFMFIPSEAIYYDLLVNKVGAVKVNTQNMIEYAFRDKHVVIVSPTSFLAYLQTVLQGLRAMEIEESAKSIRVKVDKLNRHWRAFDSYVGKLGKTLMTTVNHFNYMYKELGKVDKDVMQITERKEKIVSPEKIDKPQMDE
ncbi:MAG: DNA recombination protein RmuC [Candidatus Moranbacteria bacterium]|nr:DNA recombination protein RmuC [Candidatus Moranbacteria bacterium]